MAKNNKNKEKLAGKKKITAGVDVNDALVAAFTKAIAPVITKLDSGFKTLQASIESMEASANDDDNLEDDDEEEEIEASEEVDETMTSKKVKASKKKKNEDNEEDDDDDDDDEDDDDDDDMDSEADDEDELDDLGEDDSEDDAVEEPGKMMKEGRENKGRTVPSKKAGKPMSSSAERKYAATIATLTASNDRQAQFISKLRKQVARNKVQLQAAGERTDRRSLTVSQILRSTLSKGNIDINSMHAAGEKLTNAEVDDVFASQPNLDSVTRVGLKNEMVRAGLLEPGEVKSRYAQ